MSEEERNNFKNAVKGHRIIPLSAYFLPFLDAYLSDACLQRTTESGVEPVLSTFYLFKNKRPSVLTLYQASNSECVENSLNF